MHAAADGRVAGAGLVHGEFRQGAFFDQGQIVGHRAFDRAEYGNPGIGQFPQGTAADTPHHNGINGSAA